MMDHTEKMDLLGGIEQLREYVEKIALMAPPKPADNCLNCCSFHEETEQCAKYKARPPARTIAEGCPAWDLEIPF